MHRFDTYRFPWYIPLRILVTGFSDHHLTPCAVLSTNFVNPELKKIFKDTFVPSLMEHYQKKSKIKNLLKIYWLTKPVECPRDLAPKHYVTTFNYFFKASKSMLDDSIIWV